MTQIDPPKDELLQNKIRIQALTLMYQRMGGTQVHLFIMPAVIAVAFWGLVNHVVLMVWAAIVCAVYVTRIRLGKNYNKLKPEGVDALRYGHYYTATSLVSGLAWGAAGMLFFLPNHAGHLVLLYTSIMGLAAGSMIVTAY